VNFEQYSTSYAYSIIHYLHMGGPDMNSFSPYILPWHPHSLTSLILPHPHSLPFSHTLMAPLLLLSHTFTCTHTHTHAHMGLDV